MRGWLTTLLLVTGSWWNLGLGLADTEPVSDHLHTLVFQYLDTADSEEAERLLQDIQHRPDASIERVIRIIETEGVNLAQSDWTPDAISAHFAEISDVSKAKALQGAFEQTQKYVGQAAARAGIRL